MRKVAFVNLERLVGVESAKSGRWFEVECHSFCVGPRSVVWRLVGVFVWGTARGAMLRLFGHGPGGHATWAGRGAMLRLFGARAGGPCYLGGPGGRATWVGGLCYCFSCLAGVSILARDSNGPSGVICTAIFRRPSRGLSLKTRPNDPPLLTLISNCRRAGVRRDGEHLQFPDVFRRMRCQNLRSLR